MVNLNAVLIEGIMRGTLTDFGDGVYGFIIVSRTVVRGKSIEGSFDIRFKEGGAVVSLHGLSRRGVSAV